MRVFYDLNNITRAVAVSFLGPSVTTTSFLNPGYRIYTVDGAYDESTWQVLDFETKFMNLTEANMYGSPKWKLEYSAKVYNKQQNLNSNKLSLMLKFVFRMLTIWKICFHRTGAMRLPMV